MKILVVEDEKRVAGFIKRGLEEDDEYQVSIVYNGEDGLEQALKGEYCLMTSGVMMPKKDGFALVKELREAGSTIPVIMLTARGTTEEVVFGLEAGADDYLTKPFAFAELLARVRALLRRSQRDRGAEILFADLRLDPVTHKVWRSGSEIDLTAKEYVLLEYMMRNPDKELTRATITEHCWGNSSNSFTNIIDVYVNYLRKKIDQGYTTKLIHTVRGKGYILRE